MSDQKTFAAHRRLAVLRHLAMAQNYTSNASILGDVVNGVGVSTSVDQLTATLSWLAEQDLATLEDHGDFVIVTASARGVDVARGRVEHPGVKRPSPKG